MAWAEEDADVDGLVVWAEDVDGLVVARQRKDEMTNDVEGLITDDMMGSNPRLLRSFLFCGFNPHLSFAYDTRSASRSEAEASLPNLQRIALKLPQRRQNIHPN